MNEYHISISYTIGEKLTVKAASIAEAEQKAVELAESRLEMHDGSECSYEVMGGGKDNEEHAEGCIYG